MNFIQLFDTNRKRFLWIAGIAIIILGVYLMEEPTIGPGDTVVMDYTTSLNGIIVDTSIETIAHQAGVYYKDRTYEPLVIIIGGKSGEDPIAPVAIERELLGMKVGEEKTIRLYPLDAYGYWDEEKVVPMPIDEFKAEFGIDPVQGESVQMGRYVVNIFQVTEDEVMLDFNHRFAVNPNEEVVSKEEFEKNAEARVGNLIMYQNQYAIVIEVTDTDVILDVNPSVFEFKIEIIQIKKS
jgi:FKBP-type peptidyl-prolyl cis-trans isomerase 2